MECNNFLNRKNIPLDKRNHLHYLIGFYTFCLIRLELLLANEVNNYKYESFNPTPTSCKLATVERAILECKSVQWQA